MRSIKVTKFAYRLRKHGKQPQACPLSLDAGAATMLMELPWRSTASLLSEIVVAGGIGRNSNVAGESFPQSPYPFLCVWMQCAVEHFASDCGRS